MVLRAFSLRPSLRSLLDAIFPPRCYGCDVEIERGLVCAVCHAQLMSGRLGVCSGCGRPLVGGSAECGRCAVPFAPLAVRALGRYAPPYSGLVHALKYDGKEQLAQLLGAALARLVESDPDLSSADCVCPVPLHPARRRERGYNQSALLAEEVASATGIRLVDGLARRRNTRTQTALADDRARQHNMRGAFAPRAGFRGDGMRFVLLDDVTTSGATLDAAARQLLKAGAGSVFGLVVAAA
ncbi:ComF family protein [candidate division WOR-3 bacterium]|nr:ComF family protein [candidate division WOR-3 bacterium]